MFSNFHFTQSDRKNFCIENLCCVFDALSQLLRVAFQLCAAAEADLLENLHKLLNDVSRRLVAHFPDLQIWILLHRDHALDAVLKHTLVIPRLGSVFIVDVGVLAPAHDLDGHTLLEQVMPVAKAIADAQVDRLPIILPNVG